MAGQASVNIPGWLIVLTVGVFLGFLVAYNNSLPSLSSSSFTCTAGALYVDCVTSALGFLGNLIVILVTVLTLGGLSSPLPLLVQGPILFVFALMWTPIIVQLILNIPGSIIP